jgi:hypothetical protein
MMMTLLRVTMEMSRTSTASMTSRLVVVSLAIRVSFARFF